MRRRVRARVLELWPEGQPELAADTDLAPLRGDPAFRALVERGDPDRGGLVDTVATRRS